MDKATPTPSPASVDSVMAKAMMLVGALDDSCEEATSLPFLEAVTALRAEVERLAAQAAPTEIHADTPRHELLPRLRRLASDFQSHPLSRSISECEEAGIAMAEAAKQIEMLCRTRNTVVNHSGRMRKEIAALTEHRDFLLREIAKIDGDPGNACHYAIEAISAVCADLAEPVPPLPEGVKARFKCEDCAAAIKEALK